MKHIFTIIFFFVLNIFVINAQEIVSPSKNIKVVLENKKKSNEIISGQIFFKVMYKKDSEYIEVLPNSRLGISRKDQQFVDNLSFIRESKANKIHDKYQMICGKRKLSENFGTEKVLSYKNSNNKLLDIVFRVYNNGVAFRYSFPDHFDSLVNITSEATTYILPDSTYRWMQPYTEAYEDFYTFSKTGLSGKKEQEWGLPALYKVNDNPLWVLISEANIIENNCVTRLCNRSDLKEYKVMYPPARKDFQQSGVITNLPWSSQWYIGGLNGKDEIKTLEINFNFLGKGNFNLQLIKDGKDDKSFASETVKVKEGDKLKIDCLPRGGFVGILKKEPKETALIK